MSERVTTDQPAPPAQAAWPDWLDEVCELIHREKEKAVGDIDFDRASHWRDVYCQLKETVARGLVAVPQQAEIEQQLQTVHAHVKEALELLGVDVSPAGYIPDSWTLREQCHKAKAEIERLRAERDEARKQLAAQDAQDEAVQTASQDIAAENDALREQVQRLEGERDEAKALVNSWVGMMKARPNDDPEMESVNRLVSELRELAHKMHDNLDEDCPICLRSTLAASMQQLTARDEECRRLREAIVRGLDEIEADAMKYENAYNSGEYITGLDEDEAAAEIIWHCARTIRAALASQPQPRTQEQAK